MSLRAPPARRVTGFTLIELVLLLVVFSVALVALLGLGQVAAARIGDAGRAQAANAFASSVAETLLAARATPSLGIDAFSSTTFDGACSALVLTYTDASGSVQSVRPLQALEVPADMSCALEIGSTTSAPCTTDGVVCRQVQVEVGAGGLPLARVVLVLAGYVEH